MKLIDLWSVLLFARVELGHDNGSDVEVFWKGYSAFYAGRVLPEVEPYMDMEVCYVCDSVDGSIRICVE